MRTLVVVNPASAGGRTARHWPELWAALRDAGVEFEHRMTRAPGDAIALTRAALQDGVERVVAVGGDGTLNEAVCGYFDATGDAPVNPDACLGLLSSGTGGDFRRTAGIPGSPVAAAALIARGDVRRIDVGRVDFHGEGAAPPRHFVNIADCGIGGEVVARVNRSRKGASGRVTFFYHSMASLMTFQNRRVRLELDGEVLDRTVQNVVVANGRYFGGGMMVAPAASLDDGLFDVVVFGDLPRREGVTGIWRIYSGRHIGRPHVELIRAARVTITPEEAAPLRFDVEGEQVGHAPATLTCLPRALRLCAPAAGAAAG